MTEWTTHRPTKPGKYELSIHPDRRNFGALVASPVMTGKLSEFSGTGRMIFWSPGYDFMTDDPVLSGALWRPYVEPADPFAEPVPQSSEFKAYRLSDDAKTPNLRLILDVEPGMVTLYEADMTSRSPDAKETDMHDKIMMSQADARWLRDTLNNADLSDPPGWDR